MPTKTMLLSLSPSQGRVSLYQKLWDALDYRAKVDKSDTNVLLTACKFLKMFKIFTFSYLLLFDTTLSSSFQIISPAAVVGIHKSSCKFQIFFLDVAEGFLLGTLQD